MKAVVMGIVVLALAVMTVLVLRGHSHAKALTSLGGIDYTTQSNFRNEASSNPGVARAERRLRMTEAAFRDGLYQGRFDAEQCRPAHITSGRWSHQEDRALFADGYHQAYQRISAVRADTDEDIVAANVLVRSASCRK